MADKIREEVRKTLKEADLDILTKQHLRRRMEAALGAFRFRKRNSLMTVPVSGFDDGSLDEKKDEISRFVEEYIDEKVGLLIPNFTQVCNTNFSIARTRNSMHKKIAATMNQHQHKSSLKLREKRRSRNLPEEKTAIVF